MDSTGTSWLQILMIAVLLQHAAGFQLVKSPLRHFARLPICADNKGYSSEETIKAMQDARNCEANGLSPGAGLATADEQAEVQNENFSSTFFRNNNNSFSFFCT